ncbi:MAG: hypothetical protein ACLPZR_25705 [Solirubrobacteraceae bacterium]
MSEVHGSATIGSTGIASAVPRKYPDYTKDLERLGLVGLVWIGLLVLTKGLYPAGSWGPATS